MSKALYRKYRSKSLNEIVGQSHVTAILSRSIKQGKIAHAYLLTGPRGIGKTSIARILAHEINGLPYADEGVHLDIIEIDAASNNGVEDVRDLREKVQIAPVSAAKKVYIIDEVHMLSKAAFNALLKTLEEPPEHIVFILATTDIDKLPSTIISRTQRYGLRAITTDDAKKHLRHIAESENIKIDDESLDIIASRGDGSFRDSISLLDQLSSLSSESDGVSAKLVRQILGIAPTDSVLTILDHVASKNTTEIIATLDALEQSGIQTTVLVDQLLSVLREKIVEQPQLIDLLDALLDVRTSSQPRLKLLTTLVTAAAPRPKTVPLAGYVGELNWEALIEYVRTNHVALYSVLGKCSYEVVDGTLVLYTMRKFNKTKLDDAKYRPMLAQCLIATGAGDMPVETIPTPPPPKDSQAAAVAAIMGGGEEVTVDG
ncbi:MAG: DNA polymerase III subunit gamma/tau [Chloroflexi bacterium]|nr:MAG: DNA polymerase III subunit gamma/tau [Chloroflexota bacterium]